MTDGIAFGPWRDATFSLANHVWQTTICVAAGGALGWLVGRRHASLRHHIWFVVSLKFLVPFSWLVAAGRVASGWLLPWPALPLVSERVDALSRPFSTFVVAGAVGGREAVPTSHAWLLGVAAIWLAGVVVTLVARGRQWRDVRAIVRRARPMSSGREADALASVTAETGVGVAVRLCESTDVSGPGLVGWRRPVLLWPARLSDRLSDAEIRAIVAHEICHVRRRDNLTALVHGIVQALFWFHPAVWWIGRRLVDERERACDAEVLGLGARPDVYAASLLHVCRFGLGRPLPLVAGAGSSHLSQRVEAIMTHRSGSSLGFIRQVVLAGVAFGVVAGPVTIGAMTGQSTAVMPGRWTSGRDIPLVFARSTSAASTTTAPRAPIVAAARSKASASLLQTTTAIVGIAAQDGSAAPGEILRPNAPGVQRPALLKEVRPQYPKAAMDAKIEGVVMLEAVVRPDGTVGDLRVTRSLDTQYGLDAAAIGAAKQWQFKPAMKDGRPVAVYVTLELAFRLRDNPDDFAEGAYQLDTPGLVGPRVVKSMTPNYTPAAMRDKVQGEVTVQAVVDEHGAITRARVTKPLDNRHGLEEQAMLALGRWEFEPATLKGSPVSAVVSVTLNFRLH